MKRIAIIVLIATLCLPTVAQQTQAFFETLTDKYSEKDGFSASMLTNDMFDLYLKKKELEKSEELKAVFDKLDHILVVSQGKQFKQTQQQKQIDFFNGKKQQRESDADRLKREEDFFNGVKSTKMNSEDEMYKQILQHYKAEGFALFKTEKRMGEDLKVYLKKEEGTIANLAVITNSPAYLNLVELQGEIDLENIASLNRVMSLKGLGNLSKIHTAPYGIERGSYPHFTDMEAEILKHQKEVERFQKEIWKNQNLTEENISEIREKAQAHARKQHELAKKYREMALQYGRKPIFLSTPGDTNTVYYINGELVKSEEIISKLDQDKIKQVTVTEKDDNTVIKIRTREKLD